MLGILKLWSSKPTLAAAPRPNYAKLLVYFNLLTTPIVHEHHTKDMVVSLRYRNCFTQLCSWSCKECLEKTEIQNVPLTTNIHSTIDIGIPQSGRYLYFNTQLWFLNLRKQSLIKWYILLIDCNHNFLYPTNMFMK